MLGSLPRLVVPLLAAILVAPAFAVQVCELNGQPVNPNNGYTTQGKTGLMRCREGDGGPLQREQELQNGKFMGLVRFYRDGVLEKESRVNERGNREGLARDQSHIRFYSDHASDAPVLEWADEPFAVNAHDELRRLGKQRGWTIVDWGN